MAIITSTQLIAFVEKALSERWGYVWSAQGESYTRELAERWGNAKRAGKSYFYYVTQCVRWFGHKVADCGGLIIAALRSINPTYHDLGSSELMARCTESGPISTIPEIPGLCVWRNGHIGIYVGRGYVIEAAGYKEGVVKTPLNSPSHKKKWTKWGKLEDVDYSAEKPPAASKPPTSSTSAFMLGRLLKYKLINRIIQMRGDDVKAVQRVLSKLGLYTGTIDGVFGKLTRAAVRLFQRQKGLKVDGVIGPVSCKALGGLWTGK